MDKEVKITRTETRRWDYDETYEVIEIQVNLNGEWPTRQPVKVTIEPITQEAYEEYLETGKTPE